MNRRAIIPLLLIALSLLETTNAIPVEKGVETEFKIRRSILTANHTGRRMFGQGESHPDTNPSYLDTRNKLVIASDVSSGNQSEPFVINRSATNSPPFTVMIILVCVVLGIIVVISSALFVMRRRFYKWRLTLVSSSPSSNSGETSEGDSDEKTTEALVREDNEKKTDVKVDAAVVTMGDAATASVEETAKLTEGCGAVNGTSECVQQQNVESAPCAVEAH